MKEENRTKGIVVLEDGTVFHGYAAGMVGTSTGEICFNTGMTGYQEIYTDPSYFGQIVICTTAHIGNYGTHAGETESDQVKISGLICKKFSDGFSRPASTTSLHDYFLKNKVVAITDVDTRSMVRHVRDKGAMNCIISSEEFDVEVLKEKLKQVPSMEGLELSSKVVGSEVYFAGDENAELKVALIDYGTKRNITRSLAERGCYVKAFPFTTPLNDILAWEPDGIMLSNGPGDPSAMTESIKRVKKLIETNIPIFGICLGHQLIALAMGLETKKMHVGHRGINHPVKNLQTGKCEVTSQNHGFQVDINSANANSDVEVTHVHLNDNGVAGMKLLSKPVFSVQYHPESCPGPHDSKYLFDDFVSLMNKHKKQEV